MKTDFDKLVEAYIEECGAEINGKMQSSCYRIDFKEDELPFGRSLGTIALDHGFMVSAINPDNDLADEDSIAMWFEPFSVRTETRTVEVEKEVTIIRERNNDHEFYD